MREYKVYTVGHSTHESSYFVSLLKPLDINCLIDVRSAPFSRIAPQFNKDTLGHTLAQHGIKYAHFKEEFGARRLDTTLLDDDGIVDFQKVRETEEFKKGVLRLKKGFNQGFKIVLMCSEANPFDCHRFVMVSYQLVKECITVKHILKDGQIVDNSLLERELLRKYQPKLPGNSLFDRSATIEEQLESAYRLRNKEIGYSIPKAELMAG